MEKHSNSQSNFPVKTRKEVAHALNVSPRTISRWLKRDGIEADGRNLTPKQLAVIDDLYFKPKKNEREGNQF